MPSRLSKAVTLLLAMLIGGVMSWPGVFAPAAGAASFAVPMVCQCCGSKAAKCCQSECCVKPSDKGAPFTPATSPPTSPNEWQALASSAGFVLMPPLAATDDLPVTISPAVPVTAVPIFQRDCCYLL